MTTNLSEHRSILNYFLAQLRDVEQQQDRMRFRRNVERVGEIMAYEISKTFDYQTIEVPTVLGKASTPLPKDRIVLATILRAGLPFHQGLLNYFDQADNAFIAAYRHHLPDGGFEIRLDYLSAPKLQDCVLILADPMLATAASINAALRELLQLGMPKSIHVASVIASTAGVAAVDRSLHPQLHVWAAAVDPILNDKSYIVPGLGDAGDLAFGSKE